MIISIEVINRLIEAGRMENMEPEEWSAAFSDLKKHDSINRLHWQDWYSAVDGLSDEDLVFTIKALTFCEERFTWLGGSVSAVIWTYKALSNRQSDTAAELANWLGVYSSNPWVPYGSQRPLSNPNQQKSALVDN